MADNTSVTRRTAGKLLAGAALGSVLPAEAVAAQTWGRGGGRFEGPVTIRIPQHLVGRKYTLDGSAPDAASAELPGQLSLERTTVVRVKGAEENVETEVYWIAEPGTALPTLNLAMDPKDLFDPEEGMYVEGWNGAPAKYPGGMPANWNQEWEKATHVCWLSEGGEIAFGVDAGVEISGSASRALPQKSLNVKTKKAYGSNEGIAFPLFPERDDQVYRRFKLRNSGADWYSTLFRDALVHSLVDGKVDIDGQAYRPVQVYLNGRYWGIHNLRESLSEHYLARRHPELKKSKLDLWKNFRVSKIYQGDADVWKELVTFLEENSLERDANAAHLAEILDVPAAIDYYILQIWAANMDWPGSNVRMWRDRRPGKKFSKIRFLLFDLDDGLGFMEAAADPGFDSFAYALAENSPSHPNLPRDTLLFRRLMENPGIRGEFLQCLATQLSTVYDPKRIRRKAAEFQRVLEPEMPRHLERWGKEVAEDGIKSLDDWRREIETMLGWCDARPGALLSLAAKRWGLSAGDFRQS